MSRINSPKFKLGDAYVSKIQWIYCIIVTRKERISFLVTMILFLRRLWRYLWQKKIGGSTVYSCKTKTLDTYPLFSTQQHYYFAGIQRVYILQSTINRLKFTSLPSLESNVYCGSREYWQDQNYSYLLWFQSTYILWTFSELRYKNISVDKITFLV